MWVGRTEKVREPEGTLELLAWARSKWQNYCRTLNAPLSELALKFRITTPAVSSFLKVLMVF